MMQNRANFFKKFILFPLQKQSKVCYNINDVALYTSVRFLKRTLE